MKALISCSASSIRAARVTTRCASSSQGSARNCSSRWCISSCTTPAYGFIPCLLSPEAAAGFHGNDEHLMIDNLNMGCELMFEIVHRMCV
jgi:acetylornithine deacetylase/succinyl-diaminopimelate desuccinylase-like protein